MWLKRLNNKLTNPSAEAGGNIAVHFSERICSE